MSDLRSRIKAGQGPFFRMAKSAQRWANTLSVPLPKAICFLMWCFVRSVRTFYYWIVACLWVTPLYRGVLYRVGDNFRGGTHLPFIIGTGKIYVGNNVRFYGKQIFIFGSILADTPEIHIGDNCVISHNVTFDVSAKLSIGSDCNIAAGVTIQDCGGHPLDPERRKAHIGASEKDVRPITVGSNVWIATGSYLLPGSKVGDNCVISAMTVVSRTIPPNRLIYPDQPKTIEIRKTSAIL